MIRIPFCANIQYNYWVSFQSLFDGMDEAKKCIYEALKDSRNQRGVEDCRKLVVKKVEIAASGHIGKENSTKITIIRFDASLQ